MSEHGEGIIQRLHPFSALRNDSNDGNRFIHNTVGEYLDRYVARDKFEQLFLLSATGRYLDLHGMELGVYRLDDEDDESYRSRILLEKTMHSTIPELKSQGVRFWDYVSGLNAGSEDYYFQFYDNNSKYVENTNFVMVVTDLLTDVDVSYSSVSDSNGLCIFNLANRSNPFKFTLKSESNVYDNMVLESSMIMKYANKRNTLLLCDNTELDKYEYICFKLFNENGVGLSEKTIKITINNNNTYTITTNYEGIAYFNLDTPSNNYNITFEFEGDEDYNPCQGSVQISITNSNKPNIFVDCGIVHDFNSSELTSENTYIDKDYLAHANLKTQNHLTNKFILDGVLEWF